MGRTDCMRGGELVCQITIPSHWILRILFCIWWSPFPSIRPGLGRNVMPQRHVGRCYRMCALHFFFLHICQVSVRDWLSFRLMMMMAKVKGHGWSTCVVMYGMRHAACDIHLIFFVFASHIRHHLRQQRMIRVEAFSVCVCFGSFCLFVRSVLAV